MGPLGGPGGIRPTRRGREGAGRASWRAGGASWRRGPDAARKHRAKALIAGRDRDGGGSAAGLWGRLAGCRSWPVGTLGRGGGPETRAPAALASPEAAVFLNLAECGDDSVGTMGPHCQKMADLWEFSVGSGSGGWIRTNDQRINSPLRYRCATPDQPRRAL